MCHLFLKLRWIVGSDRKNVQGVLGVHVDGMAGGRSLNCQKAVQWLRTELEFGIWEQSRFRFRGRELCQEYNRKSGDPRLYVCQAPGALICGVTVWVHFGVHFGSILGPFWGPFWVHFGSMLGPCWVHVGSILGPFWVHVGGSMLGPILGPFWVHSGSILGPFWVHSGSILGPFCLLSEC